MSTSLRSMASETVFVVTAVDVATGALRRFSNRPLTSDLPATKIEPRHVLASGSLPPRFPWTEIDGTRLLGRRHRRQHPARRSRSRRSRRCGGRPAARRHESLSAARPSAAQSRRGRGSPARAAASATACGRIMTMARRINALVETVDELATLVAPDDRDDWLNARHRRSAGATSSSTRSSISTCRIRLPRSFRRRRIRPTTRTDADFLTTVRRRRRDGFIRPRHPAAGVRDRWRIAREGATNSSGQAEACPPSSRSALITRSLHELGQCRSFAQPTETERLEAASCYQGETL